MTKWILGDGVLLLTAIIWGGGFVAQKLAMDNIPPLTFTAIRFSLGALILLPIYLPQKRFNKNPKHSATPTISTIRTGIIAGLLLSGGATLQQIGVIQTTAGNAGFITSLYIVLVPLLSIIIGKKISVGEWIGVLLATGGLLRLSSKKGSLMISSGDLLVLFSTIFWALHVIYLQKATQTVNWLNLAIIQFTVCALITYIISVLFENPNWTDIAPAWKPLLYSSLISVGIGYTLQVIGQRHSKASHAAIIMSLESVFAVIWGGIFLGERMSSLQLCGMVFMLSGMIVSQQKNTKNNS